MLKIVLGLLLAAALTGCSGAYKAEFKRQQIGGVDCVTVTTADGGASVSCAWPTR